MNLPVGLWQISTSFDLLIKMTQEQNKTFMSYMRH